MSAPDDRQTAGAPFDAPTLAHFEKRLLEERKRAVAELGRFGETLGASEEAETGELSTYRFHLADVGTETMEQEKNHLLASHAGRLVWHIDEALRRLYRSPETFGRCHDCGRTIAYERLDALPHARFCIGCKQRNEDGKGFG